MTVAQLIKLLQDMPSDLEVRVRISGWPYGLEMPLTDVLDYGDKGHVLLEAEHWRKKNDNS